MYVPGLAAPDVSSDLVKQTYLFKALNDLEYDRQRLEETAKPILLSPRCQADRDGKAATKLVVAGIAAADKFESALFDGAFALPGTSLITVETPKSSGGQKTQPPSISNNISVKTGNDGQGGASGPSTVQQLLYIDLLLHQVGAPEVPDTKTSDTKTPTKTYLLSVHALESGGTQLTKSQSFLGTRQYFGGGAVATYALTTYNGAILCSGIAYGYRGYIKAGDFSRALQPIATDSPSPVPGTNNTLPNGVSGTVSCP